MTKSGCKRKSRASWLFACYLIFIPIVAANNRVAAEAGAADTLDEEIEGFVIDYTITGVGHNFARHLARYRAVNLPDADYNLTVKERPSARWGSLIWVESEHREYFRSFIQPGRNSLKTLAEQAADQIHQRVQQYKIQSTFADTFDMEKDEF